MPDWSYHTLFKPLLFRMEAERARSITFGAINLLSRLPGGGAIIRFMGHMDPPEELTREVLGIRFASPVGLSPELSADGRGMRALSGFGLGFLQIGTVYSDMTEASHPRTKRREQDRQLVYSEATNRISVEAALAIVRKQGPIKLPLGIWLGTLEESPVHAANGIRAAAERLSEHADFYVVHSEDWIHKPLHWRLEMLENLLLSEGIGKPVVLAFSPDTPFLEVEAMLEELPPYIIQGVAITDALKESDDAWVIGPPSKSIAERLVRSIRERWGERYAILASGGISDPQDALDLISAGADLIVLHSGLVYAGPGLPKRINEAAAFTIGTAASYECGRFWKGWGWIAGLGLAMCIGGILAWWIAATVVMLPYDEAYVGILRERFTAINERLLHFMAHDRMTLAGTMISIGIVYLMLAGFGIRKRLHWARQAVLYSASVGFLSFFLFLGFDYFDPLHALVSLLILPLFVIGMWGTHRSFHFGMPSPALRNDRAWRRGQWGQLFAVMLGASLMVGGFVISIVGITFVFVPEDLAYLCTSVQELAEANERLISLIAHDRAGFGGALFSLGIAVLLMALWGIRRGESWIWWTLALSGLPGFIAGLGVHVEIGYTNQWHLAPAYLVLAFYLLALWFLYPYLFSKFRKSTE
ncbi:MULTISPECIES: hypothetical protein [unclassified Paenibacillus]|uniref:hypothetical protein n=1 Tax=unclassified Paenibacillus TaxID=185978 RepID=UPI001AEADF64|nr:MULTISPECIES: hypothetical protein [unclassified Paenibacillus]MBP1155645.1 dihydroorotate dehydrogenase [Paenibacillus sp. PvP091]MBP1168969.1 dihydroorotate dehydrogenase [Paenibacillus sp. PvR098]MBP2439997.1 dihydroorotate dehydrogenase [Paenibacillus sp. PvP052]